MPCPAQPPSTPRRRLQPRWGRLAVLAGVVLALAASPRPAYACAWNYFHGFSPITPCKAKDKSVIARLADANLRLAGKIAVVATKSTMIASEIYGWAHALNQAKRIEEGFKDVFGTARTDPLGSLVGSYTVMGVAMNFERGPDGGLRVSPGFDIRRFSDSLFAAAFDSMGAKGLYNSLLAGNGRGLRDEISHSHYVLARQMRLLGDFERSQKAIRDSMIDRAALAGRQFARDVVGDRALSEAQIAALRAQLNRVHSSNLLSNHQATKAQMENLDDLLERSEEYQAKLGILRQGARP